MFFNERPEDFFPYTRIEVIDKPDPTGIGMTEKIFTGPLNRQLRDALSYIKNYIIKEKVIKISNQAEAVRIFNLPYAAVEESLSNAVYHKSYQIGEPITVTVTPERMKLPACPHPGLPGGVGDGEIDVVPLSQQLGDDGALAHAGGAGQDDQQ